MRPAVGTSSGSCKTAIPPPLYLRLDLIGRAVSVYVNRHREIFELLEKIEDRTCLLCGASTCNNKELEDRLLPLSAQHDASHVCTLEDGLQGDHCTTLVAFASNPKAPFDREPVCLILPVTGAVLYCANVCIMREATHVRTATAK